MLKIHLNVLDKKRQKMLNILNFLGDYGVYLAGGTALALQIGHRSSVDFDLYTPKSFKKGELLRIFRERFYDLKVIRDQEDTFEFNVKGIHISNFYYPYKLLKKPLNWKGVLIASAEDIAAMKILAISQRGKRRDFIDMYYLISMFGLGPILEMTERKFPEFDIYNGLRGLIFFSDADEDREVKRVKVFGRGPSWKKIKKFIEKKVFEYQKKSILSGK